MGRFKKGDRIIVDEDDFCGGYKAGDEFEVIHCDGEVVTFIDRDGDTRYLRHGRIKPVPVAEATGTTTDSAQAAKPKFKVGDRVRYKNPVYGEATVVRVNPDGSVVVDTHCEFGICTEAPEHIEPVAVAPQPQPQPQLTIQAGRYYRTRDGRKVGPMREAACEERWTDYAGRKSAFIADTYNNDGTGGYYASDGTWLASDDEYNHHDLVAEWTDEPPVAAQQAGTPSSTAGFTVPMEACEDSPGWYAAELGRAYADGYAAGLRAAA